MTVGACSGTAVADARDAAHALVPTSAVAAAMKSRRVILMFGNPSRVPRHRAAPEHELLGRRRMHGHRAVEVAFGGDAGQRNGQTLHDLRRISSDHVHAV